MFHALTDRLERWAYRPSNARRVIAVSERARDDLRRYYGRVEGVRVIPHGVDTDVFHPHNRRAWRGAILQQIGIPAAACVALYVGDAQKALPAAIRARPLSPTCIW